MIKEHQQEFEEEDRISQNNLYRPSEVEVGCCSKTFDLRFQQMKTSYLVQGFWNKVEAFRIRKNFIKQSIPRDMAELELKLPINFMPEFSSDSDHKIRYTWIGHSTAVINIANKVNILIDPVFKDRCSPFKNYGPKRYRETPCKIHELPHIDIVLVSHDHYDHLEDYALNELQTLFQPEFFAGLQSDKIFPKLSKINQMDWTETKNITVNGLELSITFVPVCHWSRRHIGDLCKRLWGGFVVKLPTGQKIFYPGDTGYCGIFKEIGQIFEEIDLAILPIGAYEPRVLLKPQHFNPQDSVKCHKDIRSKKSVGVHWGTFPLGCQHWHAPRQDLKIAAQKHGLKEDEFVTVGHGESLEIDYRKK